MHSLGVQRQRAVPYGNSERRVSVLLWLNVSVLLECVCVRAATISDRHGYVDFGDYQQRARIKRDKELSPRNLHKNHLR